MILTGMSGAGKTGALKCLEDLGYYAIDNLPAELLRNIVEIAPDRGGRFERLAVVMDVRGGTDFEELFRALERLEAVDYSIIFLDASNDVLLKRFSETRRIHPLDSKELRIKDTIEREKMVLQPLRARADVVIDTSELNIYELREKLRAVIPDFSGKRTTRLTFISFGFKYGHPMDADIVQDVRFLPNPFWVDELRELSGNDQQIVDYVMKDEKTQEFTELFEALLELMLPVYIDEHRPYLTVAIGCTGGRHRSVTVANELAARFNRKGFSSTAVHRDIDKK